MSSMSFQRTQSLRRPMSGTLSNRPISSGVTQRRPVTAVDFGTLQHGSVASRGDTEEWFPESNEASVCLVVGSDDESVREKKSSETLRDLALTASEYFSRSGEGTNWWE